MAATEEVASGSNWHVPMWTAVGDRKEGREVKEGGSLMAKVGNMSSGTCTCEARMESVRNQDV